MKPGNRSMRSAPAVTVENQVPIPQNRTILADERDLRTA